MQHLPCWWKCYISYKLIQYGKIMNIINNLWLNYRYVRYMADGSSILMEISPLLWLISWPRRSPLLHLKKLYGHNTFIQMKNILLNKHYWSISWWLVSYSGPNWWHILCIRNAMNDVIWWCHLIIQWHITRVHADIATAGDIEKQAGNMWTHEVISCFGMNTNIHCHTSMVSHEHITTLTNRKNERVSRL